MGTRQLLLICASAILLASACSHDLRYDTFELKDSVTVEGTEAGCTAECAFEYVTGGVDEAVQERINAYIVENHLLFEEAAGSTDVPAACRQWVQAQLDYYDVDLDGYTEDYAWMYQFSYVREGHFTAACKSRHLQTYLSFYSEYTGGAHEMYGTGADVFDLTTGAVVREEDLFAPGYEEGLAALLKASMARFAEQQEEDWEDLSFVEPQPNGNFSASEEGLTWFYNPYEIGPYAMGEVRLSVGWADLKPYLK